MRTNRKKIVGFGMFVVFVGVPGWGNAGFKRVGHMGEFWENQVKEKRQELLDLQKLRVVSDVEPINLRFAIILNDTQKAKQLIARGTDINAADFNGWTPLMFAASRNLIDIVRELVAREANVNATANDGDTALMLAAETGTAEIVQILIDAGADSSSKNKQGETALDIAEAENRSDVVNILRKSLELNIEN